MDSEPIVNVGISVGEQILFNKIRRAYRRSGLRARLSSARLIYAAGIGLIVGIGMSLFAPFVHQPRLFLGVVSGIAAFLVMLFLD